MFKSKRGEFLTPPRKPSPQEKSSAGRSAVQGTFILILWHQRKGYLKKGN
jgi:hypothetical protein